MVDCPWLNPGGGYANLGVEGNEPSLNCILMYIRLQVLLALVTSTTCFAQEIPWKVEGNWNSAEEGRYSSWVAKLGSRQWTSINQAIRSSAYNSLYRSSDRNLNLAADCADLPFVLRGYYAYRRGLPFAITIVDGGPYSTQPNQTVALVCSKTFQGTAKQFLEILPDIVHSGNFRTAPNATDSITYPLSISPKTIRPGAIFYSPEGHVAVVVEIRDDGSVYLMDAHPDQTITRTRFSPKLGWRSRTNSGGFRNFRTLRIESDQVRLVANNAKQPGYGVEHYAMKGNFHNTVRNRLTSGLVDPMKSLETYIRDDFYREVLDRAQAVELAWNVARNRPIPVPDNLYYSIGDWEAYATPSRDIRLRRSMLEIPNEIQRLVDLSRENPERISRGSRNPRVLGNSLLRLQTRLFSELTFNYRNSQNKHVLLKLADVEQRLFRLSFDPNHPPELRWGASGKERATALTDERRFFEDYEVQQTWRNRLTKKTGPMKVGDADNPASPPPHSFSRLIQTAITP